MNFNININHLLGLSVIYSIGKRYKPLKNILIITDFGDTGNNGGLKSKKGKHHVFMGL